MQYSRSSHTKTCKDLRRLKKKKEDLPRDTLAVYDFALVRLKEFLK